MPPRPPSPRRRPWRTVQVGSVKTLTEGGVKSQGSLSNKILYEILGWGRETMGGGSTACQRKRQLHSSQAPPTSRSPQSLARLNRPSSSK
eukprot:751848-Hanusia_phi.AAC.1